MSTPHQRCLDMLGDVPGKDLEAKLTHYIGSFMAQQIEIERLRERCEAYKGQVEAGAGEIESLRKQLVTVSRKAIDMRNAINDVELALAGLEIDDMVDAWEGAMNTTKLKVSLGALRQLRNSYPALNRIMNEAEYNPDQFAKTDEKDEPDGGDYSDHVYNRGY